MTSLQPNGRPAVGIAVPAYHAHNTLEETLRSCVAQTWPHWVAFVTVDGADAEREAEIVASIGDPRIHLECNGRQIGQFGNFNRATLRCYAAGVRWVKFLCADDALYPDALERMLALGERGADCGLVYGYYDAIDGSGRTVSEVDLSGTSSQIVGGRDFLVRTFSRSLFGAIGGPSSVMIRADAIERCGIFDDRLNYSGESALWYRILSRYDIGMVGERPVLRYRLHENSITGRGQMTASRFEQPIDIVREIAAHYPPHSREWRVAQAVSADIIAANLLTSLSLLRRGEYSSAAAAARVSLRRMTASGGVRTAARLVARSARLLRGAHRVPVTDFTPPTRRVVRGAAAATQGSQSQ